MNIKPTTQESFIKRRLITPLYNFLKQGTSPEKLAWAVAAGATVGILPLIGATTILCAAIALIFRLNMAAIQLINYFMYPMQLLLYIPYFAMGSKLFGEKNLVSSITEIFNLIKTDFWNSIQRLWSANMHAIVIWLITAPFIAATVFLICKPIFLKIAQHIKKMPKIV